MIEKQRIPMRAVTGEELDAYIWMPEGEPKGVIQMVHGMSEHIERYDNPAKAFAQAGWIAVGHTLEGHGSRSKILGYFGESDGWQHLLDDIDALRRQTQAQYPGLPYVLLGHSMGSFLVRCYLLQYAQGLSGAILSGTGYFAPKMVRAGLLLAKSQCRFGQAKKPSELLNKLSFASYNKPFEPARTPFDWLSRDEKTVDAYIADPLCGFLFTAAGYRDMFEGLSRLTRPENLKKMPSDLPVLFFSGDHDPVGDMGKGMRTVAEQFRSAGMRDVTVKLYPDGRHEMFNELNREEVCQDVLQWMNQQTGDGRRG